MHKDDQSDSSIYTNGNVTTREDFDGNGSRDNRPVREPSLPSPFRIATPLPQQDQQDRAYQAYSSPASGSADSRNTTEYQGSLPDLECSQSSQLSTQLRTPPSTTSTAFPLFKLPEDTPHRTFEPPFPSTPTARKPTIASPTTIVERPVTSHSSVTVTTITLQSPLATRTIDPTTSPLFRLGLCTPRRHRRDSITIDREVDSPVGSTTTVIKNELESPLKRLGLGTPRGHHRAESSTFPIAVVPGTPPPSSLLHLPSPTPGLDSPFKRLGLCTPRGRTKSPSDSEGSTSSPTLARTIPSLELPSPSWIPDTPTPYRFYTPTHPPKEQQFYDLTPPRQPVFTSPAKDVKPIIPLTPPLPTKINHDAELNAQSEVSIRFISHVSMDGGLLSGLERFQRRYEEDGCMTEGLNMFINPPKRGVRERDEEEVYEAAKIFRSFDEDFRRNSMAHAVHTTNLLSSNLIITEMGLAERLGIPTLVIHLGSEGREIKEQEDVVDRDRMDMLMRDLREILDRTRRVVLAIENTVHPSSNSLTTLQSLALLLTLLPHPRLAVCLDLAHVHIAELDLNHPQGQEDLIELLKKIGHGRIAGMHVGGGGSVHGGKGDRHVGLTSGSIDLSSLRSILHHPIFHSIPTLLEVPTYHRHFRHPRAIANLRTKTNSTRTSSPSKRIVALEEERYTLECTFLQRILNTSNEEWEVTQHKLVKRYRKDKKRIENRIYKILARKNEGSQWMKFREGRRREMRYARRLQAKKRRRREG
uniref:Xylose isomerase-like TIM barrel domain-containing protein n=1 Tax=Kwoniella bestiolae CBS 10118 TaxID=1296100 RepID=A0A1B9G8Q1_9TREE|nr:hypothetical protein I302_02231 [Kwoniella bestiolae CBS 10118]OCF27389.1 hypothetical protein I302_02231 [Kwoniella bestiolae CBS 10118]